MQGFNTDDRITKMMDKMQICYDCAYWMNIINYPPPYMEIVGNKCLKVYPKVNNRDKSMLLGGKGKIRYFIRTDWSKMICSNDIWLIGTIPKIFRKKLVPTLIEITSDIYKRLQMNSNQCSARGCFDRYHCLRYNLEIEKDHIGTFNKVPSTWKVGNEHCKDFINILKLPNDDSSVGK